MKQFFNRLKSAFFIFLLASISLSARPLIMVLDGGKEREKEYPAFNEIIEYAVAVGDIPCIVSGSILEQYHRWHKKGLQHLFKRFNCFKAVHSNLFILAPLNAPRVITSTYSEYSEYDLSIGLQCEQPRVSQRITSVDQWLALLKNDKHSSFTIPYDASAVYGLMIEPCWYGDKKPSPWVIYLAGHGLYTPREGDSMISGMSVFTFKNFVDNLMARYDCGMMLLDTCHAGGFQASRVMNHMAQCEQRHGIDKSFPMVIIGLTHDLLYSSRLPAVTSALNYYFHKNYRNASHEKLNNIKLINDALHGFSIEALNSPLSRGTGRLAVSHNFYKISKTPQVRLPGSKKWDVLPLETNHVLSVEGNDQRVIINDDVVGILIKKGALRPHLEFKTRTRSLIISGLDDNTVCFIHKVEASHIEFEDFLRYGFFDLIEPNARFVFCINFLNVCDSGKRVNLSDVLVIKERTASLVGIFGKVYFKAYGTYYKAVVGCFPNINEKHPEVPVHAVEGIDINVVEIPEAEYLVEWKKYQEL